MFLKMTFPFIFISKPHNAETYVFFFFAIFKCSQTIKVIVVNNKQSTLCYLKLVSKVEKGRKLRN